MKLIDYVWYYYNTYQRYKQRPNTQLCYESVIRNHIATASIANKELATISTRELQLFLVDQLMHGNNSILNTNQNNNLSHHLVTRIRQILIAVFAQALRENLVTKNYASETTPIPLKNNEKPIFSPEAQRKFLMEMENNRLYPLYLLLFFTGLRRSEALGLSWSNVDLKRNIIHIRQTLVMIGKKVILTPNAKTKCSRRSIPIPNDIKLILSEWKKKQLSEARIANSYANKNNLVFTRNNGSPLNPISVSRSFKEKIKKLPFLDNALHLHSIRHTWATNMIQCNVPITDVQFLGGWSRPDTLLNIYAQTVQASQRRAINKLFNTLNKKNNSTNTD